MNKLVVCIMGQNADKFLPMCLESVKEADAIVYCDGGSTDGTHEYLIHQLHTKEPVTIIMQEYNQEDKAMNGKQRNFYLKYLKQNYPNDWALCLDADEVVESLDKIKSFIQTAKNGSYNIKMRHFHNDLGHEDSTQSIHYVLNRLFKISEAVAYPEVEHPVLIGVHQGNTECTTIWHLAHINHCFSIKKRYEKNLTHSNMHSKQYLDNWNEAHILGHYPNKQVNPLEIPKIILQHFHINIDKLYFQGRNLENKHWIDVIKYIDYFKLK